MATNASAAVLDLFNFEKRVDVARDDKTWKPGMCPDCHDKDKQIMWNKESWSTAYLCPECKCLYVICWQDLMSGTHVQAVVDTYRVKR